jgi:hypothetical protein
MRLHDDHGRRDSGVALLEAFDSILWRSVLDAAVKKVGRVQAIRIREELGRTLPQKTIKAAGQGISDDDRNPTGYSAPTMDPVLLRKA